MKMIFMTVLSWPLLLTMAASAAPAQTPLASPSEVRCSLSYSEYYKGDKGLKTIWQKPIPYDAQSKTFNLKVDGIPMKSIGSLNLQIDPYTLNNQSTDPHDIGIHVEANNMEIEGNFRTYRPSIRASINEPATLCNFSTTWDDFPQVENGVWSQWLMVDCEAPIEFCEFSPQD